MKAFIGPGLCVAAALAWGSTAAAAGASATARANGEVQISDSAGILVTQDLSFQTQLPSSNLQSFASSGSGNVMLTGGAGQTVSLAVPTSFDVTRAGGPESYVVTTFGVPGSSLLGGSLRENGALSVDVSGRVALAGKSTVPGAYRGLLVVIAQYN